VLSASTISPDRKKTKDIDRILSKEPRKCYSISSCDSVVVRVKFTFAKESKEESG